MKDKFEFLEMKDRKKILLLCDDIRAHSGIAHMAREIVINTAHHYNWFNIGARLSDPDRGRTFDLSKDIAKIAGIEEADVKVHVNEGYGDPGMLRSAIRQIEPDAIMIFTDPRYWIWLFEIEREVRSKIPLFYLNIWDNYPAPLYNKQYYKSCDLLMAISKQTLNINKIVLGDDAEDKVLKYVPHGVSDKTFFPITEEDENYEKFSEFRNNIFNGKDYDFVALWNSRNVSRKQPADVLLSFKYFCDKLPEDKAAKCALIMHTNPVDNNGTDLLAVKKDLLGEDYNVFFSNKPLLPEQMNLLYNLSDVVMLISSNEGWGLSITEGVMTGRMVVGNVTGGIQDQFRFEDENGNWIDFDEDFPTNHNGTYTKHGEWAMPVFPAGRKIIGSPLTPYIFDDVCDSRNVAEALEKVYDIPKKERLARGMKGRMWMQSEEASMTNFRMGTKVIQAFEEAFDKYVPRESYEIIKVEDVDKETVTHNLD